MAQDTRYNKGDIVEIIPPGDQKPIKGKIVRVHNLKNKTNYEVMPDKEGVGTGIYSFSDLNLVRRGDEIPGDMAKVKTKKRINEFIGPNKRYGPFSEGEVVVIPQRNAEVMEDRGSVEIIEK